LGSNNTKANNVPTKTVKTSAGHTLEYKGNHLSGVTTKSGAVAHFDSHGRAGTIKTANGTVIQHGPRGERTVVRDRADHSRVVSYGHGRGYVQRSFTRGGRVYASRTYVYGGRTYTRVYSSYYYHGYGYYNYVPGFYYAPAFYGWAYAPWGPSIAYGWGWGGAPWYGYYGSYFAPAPYYPSAAFWLTDYVIAANLQAAYEAQQQAAVNASGGGTEAADNQGGGSPAITPEMKQLIADEVQRQLQAERDAQAQQGSAGAGGGNAGNSGGGENASNDVPPSALDPKQSMFVVSASLDVPAGDDSCALTAGDLIERLDDSPGDDNAVAVRVLSSKPKDCQTGTKPRVQVADLQEMSNDFREKIDQGLGSLAENQGKNGLPKGPAGHPTAVAEAKVAADPNATADLKALQSDADQADQEVQQASSSGASGGGR